MNNSIDATPVGDTPRIVVIPTTQKGAYDRLLISHPGYLLTICLHCGGALSVIFHHPPAGQYISPLKECRCGGESGDV